MARCSEQSTTTDDVDIAAGTREETDRIEGEGADMIEVGWFDLAARPNFERFLLPRADEHLECLQIGAFIGDASVWMMENLPKARLVDVDPFIAVERLEEYDFDEVNSTYHVAVQPYEHRCRLMRMTSEDYFFFGRGEGPYDFVYVDGDHLAPTTLSDGVHAFERLRPGGLLAFDDYTWNSGRGPLHRPGPAIDAFCYIYAERIEVLNAVNTDQIWVRKL